MFSANVGDDVWDEDQTVKALENKIAKMFAMEAALFCPSGTMANQIAIKVHTQPGDEVVCDYSSHIYQYEGGGIAFNSSASVNLLKGTNGKISVALVKDSLKEENIHFPRTSLVSVENTTNKGGGACYNLKDLQDLATFCSSQNLAFHMDGARLFNAIVKTNTQPKFIHQAKRIRKVLGGGMRQVGYLAAACDYALEHHIDLLKEDHRRAHEIETLLKDRPYVTSVIPVETNIIIFSMDQPLKLVEYLKTHHILCSAISSNQIRFVTHFQFDDGMLKILKKALLNYS